MSPRQRVVVTGGIGSGKTSVIDALSGLGWSIIKTDVVGHEVLMDPAAVAALAALWPTVVVQGKVNRSDLAGIVFRDVRHLAALEDITHPLIVDRVDRWIEGSRGFVAIEVPVAKVGRRWGPLVVVHAPLVLRRQRALDRGMTVADVDSRMAIQPSDFDWLATAGYVIDNRGTINDLEATVRRFDAWARSA